MIEGKLKLSLPFARRIRKFRLDVKVEMNLAAPSRFNHKVL